MSYKLLLFNSLRLICSPVYMHLPSWVKYKYNLSERNSFSSVLCSNSFLSSEISIDFFKASFKRPSICLRRLDFIFPVCFLSSPLVTSIKTFLGGHLLTLLSSLHINIACQIERFTTGEQYKSLTSPE